MAQNEPATSGRGMSYRSGSAPQSNASSDYSGHQAAYQAAAGGQPFGGQWHGAQQPYQPVQQSAQYPRQGEEVPPQTPQRRRSGSGNGSGNGGSRQQKPGKKPLRTLLISLAVLAVGASIAMGCVKFVNQQQMAQFVAQYNNVFCPNVYVDGINLGGMTAEEGMRAVQQQAQLRNEAWYVTLTYQGEVVTTLTAGQLGMVADVTSALQEAWALGHTGDLASREKTIAQLYNTPHYGYTVTPGGNTTVVDNVLATISGYIYQQPQDAYMIKFDPGLPDPFVFSPETHGRYLDVEPLKAQIYAMMASMQSGSIAIEPSITPASVTVEALRKKLTLRADVYTEISTTSTEDRTRNIIRSMEKMNGYILQPGQTFSFNGVVGKRTVNNGFYYAIEYAYGEQRLGVGGGVCQASTTLYQAAVKAGMAITHREPHSDAVNYAEYGMDATVYWEGDRKIDFTFKNNTDAPVYICAAVESNPNNRYRKVARVRIYGDYIGDHTSYKLETTVVKELEPPAEPVYKQDKEAKYVKYTDQQKVVEKATKGYVVESYCVKYVGDTAVERTHLGKDTYKAKPQVIYVGVTERLPQ